MGKLKSPLHSLAAAGRLGEGLTFLRRRKQDLVEKTPLPTDRKSLAQLSWRHMYQKAVALWHALSPAEKQDWESQARSRHMTGFAWFMSQALKPNPGLYLPLQGGTMAGDIDMAKNRLLKLPLPSDSQEPLTLAYFTANIAPYLYDEGARVYHNANQSIPHSTWTTLAFNSERWDTDAIHDPVTNNSRLTCKTAGKYLITANLAFFRNVNGERLAYIYLNATSVIAFHEDSGFGNYHHVFFLTTIYDLAVNDYVEVKVFQDSGGALNLFSIPEYSPEFMMQRIG